MILVDTNILLDLVTDDPNFAEWSIAQLEAASLIGPLIINDVIYAELSVRYDAKEDLDTFIIEAGLKHEPVPNSALFLGKRSFKAQIPPKGPNLKLKNYPQIWFSIPWASVLQPGKPDAIRRAATHRPGRCTG